MHAPVFWKEKTFLSTLLQPFALLYGMGVGLRLRFVKGQQMPVPVLSIGNLVAGGAGKTPVALAIGAMLKARGIEAHYLSRGYGGNLRGPVQVDPAHHGFKDVGDEPLLLAAQLPTWVSKDKVAGAKAAIAAGAKYIIMDDGFQNPTLAKAFSLLVIDGEYGLGNGRLLPAGPLRETPKAAFARATLVVMMGEDTRQVCATVPAATTALRADIVSAPAQPSLAGKDVLAFAGIARPQKFHRTLQSLGCVVKKMMAYPDHHSFSALELETLQARALQENAQLVTTTKDYVRLPPAMQKRVIPVAIEAVFGDEEALLRIILPS